ncbi:MAG: macro domain-containing protein [Thermoplasmata archaeon]
MKKKLSNKIIELVKGDIASQSDCDTVVNAANARLRMGGGVAGAIHTKAGPDLERECEPLAPISPGEAVITSGHELPNDHVIHCLGPIYGKDKPEDELLAKCYRNALRLADENDVGSVAFPAISTGAFGYPVDAAAEVALNTVVRELDKLKNVRRVRFVLHSDGDLKVHEKILESLL